MKLWTKMGYTVILKTAREGVVVVSIDTMVATVVYVTTYSFSYEVAH
jgi:hypothetical protein